MVTGAAGFIGSRLSYELIRQGKYVLGLDNLNNYYDVNLKKYRLNKLITNKSFKFYKTDLSERNNLKNLIEKYNVKVICHLAAQAGVRHSLKKPKIYLKYNIDAFLNILEACRAFPSINLVYASSSSVYGGNKKVPFAVTDDVSNPVSLYAATKRSNELMAESYSKLFKLNIVGLRFFTVYGPWGRPDMAIWKFTESILKNRYIDVYNKGNLGRDFTFIDDITKGIIATLNYKFTKKKGEHLILNLGNNSPVSVTDMIKNLERILSTKAKKRYLPMQPGDVKNTYADIEKTRKIIGYAPKTSLADGLVMFTDWYKKYKKI